MTESRGLPLLLDNRIPPPLVGLATALMMWGMARALPAKLLPDSATMWLCGVLVAASLLLDVWALLAFRRARTTINPLAPENASSLVLSGPYRISRNPMYLGMALLLSRCVVWFGQPLNLLLLAAFVGYITVFQIMPEEAAMTERFGDEFRRYRARVRRWI